MKLVIPVGATALWLLVGLTLLLPAWIWLIAGLPVVLLWHLIALRNLYLETPEEKYLKNRLQVLGRSHQPYSKAARPVMSKLSSVPRGLRKSGRRH